MFYTSHLPLTNLPHGMFGFRGKMRIKVVENSNQCLSCTQFYPNLAPSRGKGVKRGQMGKGAHLPYMFGFLEVNGRQIYPFYSFTPPSKHGPRHSQSESNLGKT